VRKIRRKVTREIWIFFKKLAVSPSGDYGMADPDRLEQKGTKRTNYQLADTNFTNSHQFINLFVTIRVIRVFTRLRLNRATVWQAAAFPRKAFEMRERRVRPPRPDRALKCKRFRISSLAERTKTGL
jgi:hypothetical protein